MPDHVQRRTSDYGSLLQRHQTLSIELHKVGQELIQQLMHTAELLDQIDGMEQEHMQVTAKISSLRELEMVLGAAKSRNGIEKDECASSIRGND